MKNVGKAVCFLGLLLLMLMGCSQILQFKYMDGLYHMKAFYELEEDSLDVLVLGSSHAYEDINPAVLWKEQGIAAYISLEERMACGVGACLGCVCRTKEIDSHSHVHNARICTDGPVFEAGEVEI